MLSRGLLNILYKTCVIYVFVLFTHVDNPSVFATELLLTYIQLNQLYPFSVHQSSCTC